VDLRDRLQLEHPILQSGMAGGLSSPELVAAVTLGGGLGTIGLLPPSRMRADLRRARDLARGRTPAVNLLVPFVRDAHVDVCVEERPPAVVLFHGFAPAAVARLRAAGIFVLHQVGTPAEAQRALADGADALIAQGLEAGGHLLADRSRMAALKVLLEVADGRPVIAAGGVATAGDVAEAMGAGAAGVLCGTRFLLTEEAAAHPAYKRRILGATRTLVTRLFGTGWRARHRVVPNLATERWCDESGREPRMIAPVQRLIELAVRFRTPTEDAVRAALRQRLSLPFYSPASLRPGMPEELVEVTPLYAGEGARAMHRVVPAVEALKELASA
jgi:NAD(P)H-dependent flavin oxidoreductase YrpB (nitropropane dioxygenase family)